MFQDLNKYGSDFDISDKSKIKANIFEKNERMKKVVSYTPVLSAYYLPCSFGVTSDKYTKV